MGQVGGGGLGGGGGGGGGGGDEQQQQTQAERSIHLTCQIFEVRSRHESMVIR